LLGYGMLSCRTFDEVLRLVARHFHLMTETFTLCYQRSMATGAGEAIFTPAVAMSREVLHFLLEALAVSHDNQLRQILPVGMGSAGYDIYLSMPPPAHLTRYLALAPTRFHFDEDSLPGVRVVIGPNVLECPLPFSDARMVSEVDQRCGDMAPRRHRTSEDWVEYLRMMLRHVEGDIPTLESIARANQVSPRTIERHLNRENISFRELLHETRFERACQLLGGSPIPVSQVAHQLGFSNAANFSRAFRRVIGTTPAIFRERFGRHQP
jgi:AraC-like DNA-binding protein